MATPEWPVLAKSPASTPMPARVALATKSYAGFDGDIFERSVALIAVELVGLCVVGYQKIGPASIFVFEDRVIEQGDAERFGTAIKDAAGCGHVLECAVAAVVKQPAGFAAIGFRSAIGFVFSVEATKDIAVGRP